MTQAWDELVSAALVGTERRPYDLAALGGVLATGEAGGAVDLDVEGTEAAVLAAAAVLATYRRAGRLAGRGDAAAVAAAPPDGRAVCSSVAVQVLELLLDGHVTVVGGNADLLAEWLGRCAASGRRPPERLLVRLLDLGTASAELRSPVAAVAGPRGGWLAARNPAWSWAGTPAAGTGGGGDDDLAHRFATAGRGERVALLVAVRADDPAAGRSLVEATWRGESAADRAAFVAALATGLSDDDEAFLEASLDDRAASVRSAANHLLDRLPRSRRAARMAARALPLVRVEGRVRKRIVAELPDDLDPATRRDGVGDRPAAGVGLRAWWLVQLVGGTPLAAWEEHLGLPPSDAVRLAAGQHEVLAGWKWAAVAQGDRGWAQALAAADLRPELLAVLGADGAASMMAGALAAGAVQDVALPVLLDACPGPWSERFSAQVVASCRKAASRLTGPVRPALPLLAARLHPSVLPAIEDWIAEFDEGASRRDVRGVAHALTIRRTIQEELR